MEVESGVGDSPLADLPPNLVENTAEQVNTGLRHYRTNKEMWLNFAEDDNEMDDSVIQLGEARNDNLGNTESIVLTLDNDDVM